MAVTGSLLSVRKTTVIADLILEGFTGSSMHLTGCSMSKKDKVK